jgi:hypothetical protein
MQLSSCSKRRVNSSSIKAMVEPQAESVVDEVPLFTKASQAIFWHKMLDANGVSHYWGHFGSDPCPVAFVAFDPERHVCAIGFINTGNSKSITLTLRQIMFRLFEAAEERRTTCV